MFQIIRYNIKDHAKEVQSLLEKYIVPTYLRRMGLTPEERMEYVDFKPVLDPKGAFNKKFEPNSLVAVDNDGKMIGCQTSFYMDTYSYLEDLNKMIEHFAHKQNDCLQSNFKDLLIEAHEYNKVVEKFPGTDRIVFLESTIVDPQWRKQMISTELHKESLNILDDGELVLLEGMMPTRVNVDKDVQKHLRIGFKLHATLFKYDGYGGPILYRPPN